MAVKFLRQDRIYKVTCDKCNDSGLQIAKNKIVLRDLLRAHGWIWRDEGILGIVTLTCPICAGRKEDEH